MQFQYNADYPGLSAAGPTIAPSSNPLAFPPAQPIPCARITTRVYHPDRNQVATVQNVLVQTARVGPRGNRGNDSGNRNQSGSSGNGIHEQQTKEANMDSFSSLMSSSSSSSSSSGDSMNLEDDHGAGQAAHNQNVNNNNNNGMNDSRLPQNAYWIQRTIREAIYGRVLLAVVLRRRTSPATDGAEWEVTTDHCAVKELSWQHIKRESGKLAEDPIKEVSAMQYIQQWFAAHNTKRKQLQQQQQQQQQQLQLQLQLQLQQAQLHPHLQMQSPSPLQFSNEDSAGICTATTPVSHVAESFQAMRESNIMMPLDLLSDERNLYSIMPYCDGGELFERLDLNERFSEEEARYWMDQVLNGIETLQHVGICHRDMSLENLLVHKDGALVIDLGMCLRIPHDDNDIHRIQTGMASPTSFEGGLATSFNQMNVNGVNNPMINPAALQAQIHHSHPQSSLSSVPQHQQSQPAVSCRGRPRRLIAPQGTCGKWIYMSPEIYQNSEAFDGYAVDMWAAGVILFLMLTGFPPWERACPTDERFHYMTAGYLVQMLTEWEIGLSSDSMDLLQRMLFLDPKDRLSLDQVRAHPWMVNGQRAHPLGLGGTGSGS